MRAITWKGKTLDDERIIYRLKILKNGRCTLTARTRFGVETMWLDPEPAKPQPHGAN